MQNRKRESASSERGPGNCLTQIRVGDVLLDHALGVKERAVDGDGVEHNFEKFGTVVVIERENDVFEFVIERFGFTGIVGRNVGAAMQFPDGPACYAFDVTFDPPAVKNAQAWDAIERSLHAASA